MSERPSKPGSNFIVGVQSPKSRPAMVEGIRPGATPAAPSDPSGMDPDVDAAAAVSDVEAATATSDVDEATATSDVAAATTVVVTVLQSVDGAGTVIVVVEVHGVDCATVNKVVGTADEAA